MKKSLIPNKPSIAPNYYCTFNGQGCYNPKRLLELNKEKYAKMDPNKLYSTLLNEETLLGDRGLARTLFPENRSDLFFLLDDGWDIPIVAPNDYYGSCILDNDKFPSFTGSPEERLIKINQAFKNLGWRGVGLWIACQEAPAIIQTDPSTMDDMNENAGDDFTEMEPKYWVDRMKWMHSAGIEYWKVDWGSNDKLPWFREMISKIARKYAPKLRVEHAKVFSPLNTPLTKEEVKIAKAEGASWIYLDEGDQGHLSPSVLSDIKKNIKYSDVFRLYDISGELGIPTMIERAAQALAAFGTTNPTRCLLNCEVIPYLGAGLGLCIGIMSHPLKNQQFHSRIILDGVEISENLKAPPDMADAFRNPPLFLDRKMLEIVRTINWHRIAPPFPVGGHETHLSSNILADSWDLTNQNSWYAERLKKVLIQRAPATVCRNISPIIVSNPKSSSDSSQIPYVVASQNPNGAISIVTLGRVFANKGYMNPEVDLMITIDVLNDPIGIFGNFHELTINAPNISSNHQVWAQDLAESIPLNITSKIKLEKGILKIPGKLAREICPPFNTFDLSEPGIVFQIF